MSALIIVFALILLMGVVVAKSVALVPQAEAAVIERLGRYSRTASGQLTILLPFIDRIRAKVDLRERVVSFPPQAVITKDNLTVSIDTVVYFQVTSPQAAVYEIDNYIAGVEQLATTTLRNVVGGMTLEDTLTSRETINRQLRGVLDEATGRWGLRVARVELKSIDPPPSIQESMEKQMKADREKRAMILTAEGQREAAIKTAEGSKFSQILAAEGAKQAAILSAEAERQSTILRAQGDRAAHYLESQGQAKAIEKTVAAIKSSRPTPEVLAYQYLQTLPEMAQGDANKVWLVPSDFGKALEGFARGLGLQGDDGVFRYEPGAETGPERSATDDEDEVADWFTAPAESVAASIATPSIPTPSIPTPSVVPPIPAVSDPAGYQVPGAPGPQQTAIPGPPFGVDPRSGQVLPTQPVRHDLPQARDFPPAADPSDPSRRRERGEGTWQRTADPSDQQGPPPGPGYHRREPDSDGYPAR